MPDPTREELLVAAAIDFASAEALVVRADKIDPDNNPIDAACVAMARALLGDGWNPIETAPKDGTKFWGLVGEDAIAMFWHPRFAQFVSAFRRMQLAPGYKFENGDTANDHSPTVHKPTHWRPLPTPPSEKPDAEPLRALLRELGSE